LRQQAAGNAKRHNRRPGGAGNPCALPRRRCARFLESYGFTIVELVVVVIIITLVLALVIPGLSAMATESRYSAATQTIRSAVTRAHVASQADRNMVALRFVPDEWDTQADAEQKPPQGRQHMVTYAYRTTTDVEVSGGFEVQYQERFERREDSKSVALPTDIWAAPVEALSRTTAVRNGVLEGTIGQFELDPTRTAFLPADDFLIVFDPQTGLQGAVRAASPNDWTRYPLLATDFTATPFRERPDVRRFNFAGVVLYRREPFTALGRDAAPDDREPVLRRFGRPYFVHRSGGGLVTGLEDRSEVNP
jgi:type II secretory pathway pseudopilin PulG